MSTPTKATTDAAAFNYLKEWATTYSRHRDIPLKKIRDIKDTQNGFQIINKDGTSADCVILPSLKNALHPAETRGQRVIVTLSNIENIKEVCKAWDAMAADRTLLIIFANPLSEAEDRWVLKPHLHNKVCDTASLTQGLKAMSEFVEPIDEETLTLRIGAIRAAEVQ
ncbi:hypothetical protein HYU17_00660 [Candidatus Woesearchaeota archaeon]|nr:hypothetical protein [Candidatus Woesearchaeota archaeon]